jgi:hypothetical protein
MKSQVHSMGELLIIGVITRIKVAGGLTEVLEFFEDASVSEFLVRGVQTSPDVDRRYR